MRVSVKGAVCKSKFVKKFVCVGTGWCERWFLPKMVGVKECLCKSCENEDVDDALEDVKRL